MRFMILSNALNLKSARAVKAAESAFTGAKRESLDRTSGRKARSCARKGEE